MEAVLHMVWIRDFARTPRPQIWSQPSFAMDAKAEDERIVRRARIAPRHLALPIDDLVKLYPAEAT